MRANDSFFDKKQHAALVLAMIVTLVAVSGVLAADGALDATFDKDGKVTTDFDTGSDDRAYFIAIQPDSKIIVVGTSNNDFALARYSSDGSLDTSFDIDGKVTTAIGSQDDVGYAVAYQSDGKIIMTGSSKNDTNSDFALARYTINGSLDMTFDTDGKVTTDFENSNDFGHSIAIQSDGRIVVAGYSFDSLNTESNDFALARYHTDGSLDIAFGIDGKVITDFGGGNDGGCSVAIQSDGKIVMAGWAYNSVKSDSDFALARYNSDGSLDTTFDIDGKVTTAVSSQTSAGYAVAIQTDGKIVVAGEANVYPGSNFALARYNSDGSLDTTFDTDGKVITAVDNSDNWANSVVIQSDGKIVAAGFGDNGNPWNFALVRYNRDGSLDTTFDTDGKVTANFDQYDGNIIESIALQPNGKIVAAGVSYGLSSGDNSDFALARYNEDTATFVDVPVNYWAWSWIERLYRAGITGGCSTNPISYCAEQSVTRAQMAVFLERGIRGSSYTPPTVGTSTGFIDVPIKYWPAAWIKQLAEDGITSGCAVAAYCPESAVTRSQIAVFLLKAKYGSSYTPPAVGSSTGFSDVPIDYWAGAWIKQLAAEGITGGCGTGVYCPESPVTRAQMAVFLVKTFNLPL